MALAPDSDQNTLGMQKTNSLPPIVEVTQRIEKENEDYITGARLFAVIGSVMMVCFLMMIDQSILGTAVPQITSNFHSLSDVGWYTGAYQLATAALQPLSGKLYTHFSVKSIFLVFLFVFEIGSLICGVAPSSMALIVGRAVAGLGASGLVNGAMTMIAGAVPLTKRPLYTGIILGTAQIGILTGPLIGGALTQYTTWRWCFYINLPIGGVSAIILVLIHVPDLTVKDAFSLELVRKVLPELDLIGFALFAPASIMFLLALQYGGDNTYSWDSATIIGLFCGASGTVIIFIFWEWRMGSRAMLPGDIIKQRIVWASAAFGLCLMCCVFVTSYYMPIYFQPVRGKTPTMSGVSILPSILSQLLLVIVSGAAVPKMGYYLPWAVICGAVTAIGCGLLSTLTPTSSTGEWIGYQIVSGAGRGCGLQMGLIAVQNILKPSQIPVAIAFLIFVQSFGAAISIVIATTIFTQTLIDKVTKYTPSISPQLVLAAGGGPDALRALVRPGPRHDEELMGLLTAYTDSLRNVFYLLVAFAVIAFAFSWAMGWNDIRKKDADKEKEGSKVSEEKVQGEV